MKIKKESFKFSLERDQAVKSVIHSLAIISILLVFILVPGWILTIRSYVELAAPLSVIGISFLATVLIALSIPIFYLAKPIEQPSIVKAGKKQMGYKGAVSKFLILVSFTSFSTALIILLIINITGLQ